MIRSKDHAFDYRLALVRQARTDGIRSAASTFQCSRNTVRKWLRRYTQHGVSGLHEQSRRPNTCPHKTPPHQEAAVIRQRKKTATFGARRLKHEFALAPSVGAISRILRQNRLTRPRRKKYQRKNDLRAVKAKYAPFTRLKMDVKFLTDIPHYWPFLVGLGLPRYQYTLREVRLGAVFTAFGQEYGVAQSTAVVSWVLEHLAAHGVPLRDLLIQTDGGSEFEGSQATRQPGGFGDTIETRFGATHRVVPGCPNAQSEVESFHALIETEFFDLEEFASPLDFWRKILTYQAWFNLVRKNSYRQWNSPADLLAEAADPPPYEPTIFLLPPVHVDTLLAHQVGHDVPAHPETKRE